MEPLGFIFDLDGTIVDSLEDYREVWRDLIREFGAEHDPDLLMGHSARDGLRLMLGRDLADAEIAAIVARQAAMGRARMERRGVQAQPGVRELIEGLHRLGVRLAVATLAECDNAEWCLEQIGVRNWFSAIVGDSDVTHSKPHPEVYLQALRELGVPAERCAALEDSPNGIKAAKGAGLRCIGVLSTHALADLAEADWIVESAAAVKPEEIVQFILD